MRRFPRSHPRCSPRSAKRVTVCIARHWEAKVSGFVAGLECIFGGILCHLGRRLLQLCFEMRIPFLRGLVGQMMSLKKCSLNLDEAMCALVRCVLGSHEYPSLRGSLPGEGTDSPECVWGVCAGLLHMISLVLLCGIFLVSGSELVWICYRICSISGVV